MFQFFTMRYHVQPKILHQDALLFGKNNTYPLKTEKVAYQDYGVPVWKTRSECISYRLASNLNAMTSNRFSETPNVTQNMYHLQNKVLHF